MPRAWPTFLRWLALTAVALTALGADTGFRPTAPVQRITPRPIAGAAPTPGVFTGQLAIRGPGTLRTLQLADAASHGSRDVEVYTPNVQDPDALPVLYLLHGQPGSPTDLCSAATAGRLDALFRSGVRPFIVACPDGNSGSDADTEWADSVDGRIALETFVTGEVRVAIEGAHPRLSAMRAIGGFSMGGFGAASIALRHRDLYTQVVTLAGYFHLDDPDGVFGPSQPVRSAHDPSHLVGAGRLQQRWFLAEARGDALPLTAHDSERFAAVLRHSGAGVSLTVTPGRHGSTWAREQVPAVAHFLADGWGRP